MSLVFNAARVQLITRQIKKEALDKISQATNTISTRLGQITGKIPSWNQTLILMIKIFGLIDLGAFMFFGPDSKDQSVETAFSSLQSMAAGIGGNIE